MTLRNRGTPLGEVIASPARGLVYGNRGCLHDETGAVRRRYDGRRWIACRLEFRGRRRRPLRQPGRFTELFFLDEATALAAGHRPCAMCRHADHIALVTLWRALHPDQTGADAIDLQLHAERVLGSHQRHHAAPLDGLPDGTFVLHGDAPRLVLGEELLRWTPAGYTVRLPRPAGLSATVITPPSLVALLRTDRHPLVPVLHPSSRDELRRTARQWP